MTARTRQAAACLEAAERDIRAMQTGMVLDGIWQNAGLSAFVNECGRYADDPDYRAKVDADRAARQAEVHARMDAGIARFRAEREADQLSASTLNFWRHILAAMAVGKTRVSAWLWTLSSKP